MGHDDRMNLIAEEKHFSTDSGLLLQLFELLTIRTHNDTRVMSGFRQSAAT